MRAFAIAASLAVLGVLGIRSPAGAETKTYSAALSAAEETPTPGPAGGTGNATITIDLAAKTLCYDVTWSQAVGTPSAGHIHRGPKGLSCGAARPESQAGPSGGLSPLRRQRRSPGCGTRNDP